MNDSLQSGHPLISVITLTHNRKDRLGNLLRALRRQDYPIHEVIVIDNASTDGTVGFVRSSFPEVHVIECSENQAMFSYNRGVRAAQGELLMMVDDDGLPARSDWITQVVRRFEANPRLGVVACTVRMWDTGRVAPDSPQFIPAGDGAGGYPCAAYNGTGFGVRRTAIDSVGYFYPRYYFRTYNELHLCTRLVEAGWDVRLFPELEVWHCRATGSSDPPFAYYGLRNYYWYVWSLYPMPEMLTETLHELGSRLKWTLLGKVPPGRLWQALHDTLLDRTDAFHDRNPVSHHTLRELRRIRHHGSWHGIAPEVVPFRQDILQG